MTSYAEIFVALLNAKFEDAGEFASNRFGVNVGRKFDKVWQESKLGGRSVHAFVDRETGEVYKSAGWKAPAKGVRFASVDEAAEAADLYGAYLYVR